jgi:hypothetical protein
MVVVTRGLDVLSLPRDLLVTLETTWLVTVDSQRGGAYRRGRGVDPRRRPQLRRYVRSDPAVYPNPHGRPGWEPPPLAG